MDKMYKNLEKERKKCNGEIDKQVDLMTLECEEKQKTILDLQSNSYNLKKVRMFPI